MARAQVIIREWKLDTRVPSFPGLYVGIIGPFAKGEVNTKRLVNGEADILKYYTPDQTIKVDYTEAYFSALAVAQNTNKVWMVRSANNPLYGGCFLAQDTPLSLAIVVPDFGTSTLTFPTGTTEEIEIADTFFDMVATAEKIQLTTTGVLPTGLSLLTTYYVIVFDEENRQIQLAASKEDAENGIYVEFTDNGSGDTTLNLIGTNSNGEVEYGMSLPSSYDLDSSDGKLTGLSSAFTVLMDRDAFICSDEFNNMSVTGDRIQIAATVYPKDATGTDLLPATDYYVIKVVGESQIKLADSLVNANLGVYIELSTPGTDVVGTLMDKADTSAFTANAVTDELTVTANFFDAVTLNNIVNLTTTGTLPKGLALSELFEITCYGESTLAGGEYFNISDTLVNYYVWFTVGAINEITSILCTDATTFAGGEYFTIDSTTTSYYLWFTKDSVGVDPAPGGTSIGPVDVVTGDSAIDVAGKIATALHAVGGAGVVFSASAGGTNTVTCTHVVVGACTDATDGTSPVTTSVSAQGVDPTGIDPAPGGTPIPVALLAGETATQVATKVATAIHAVGGAGTTFSASPTGSLVEVEVVATGNCTDAADVDTGFDIVVTQQGSDGVGVSFYTIPGTGTEIQLARSIGGSAIDIINTGTGVHTITFTEKESISDLDGDLSNDILNVSATFYEWIATTDDVRLTSTGTLPAGLNSGVDYYVIKLSTTNQIKLATSINAAKLGVAIQINDSGTGVHTILNYENQELLGLERKCLLIYGSNQGRWNRDIYITTLHYPYGDPEDWTLSQQEAADTVKVPGAFLIYVWKKTETGDGTVYQPETAYLCSRDKDAKDGYGNSIYVETVLQRSNYIRGINNTAIDSSILPKDQDVILQLANGSDGDTVSDAHQLLALDLFYNKRASQVTLLLDGGWATPSYQKQGLITLCETRKDCFAVLSCPLEDEISNDYLNEVVAYRKEELNANTSYAALYTPHLLITDKYNARDMYVPPDGYVGSAISETASNYEIWYPPAGEKRGILNVLGVAREYLEGDQDVLYDNGINPIDFYPGRGIRIWGQKTLLAIPASDDRINVRLLLIVIEPAIAAFLDTFLFDLNTFENDASTRKLIEQGINSYMQNIKSRLGVYDFRAQCDEANNSNEDIDANRLNVWLFVQPTKSIEEIPFTTIITRTGASLSLG